MIFVSRSSAPPASLSSEATLDELRRAADFYSRWSQGDAAFGNFVRYREFDVQEALKTLFNGKCAYCELVLDKGSFEVEHYRPKAFKKGNAHTGYWWLAAHWNNLLPTCPGCNKGLKQHVVTADMSLDDVTALRLIRRSTLMGKANQFPVGGQRQVAIDDNHSSEDPHIIDPTRSDPQLELSWRNDTAYSVLEPSEGPSGKSTRGEATIHCLALNRIDLVQARTAVLNRLKMQRTRILERLEDDFSRGDDVNIISEQLIRQVTDMKLNADPNQPFSAMAHAFIDSFRLELQAWMQKNAGS